MAMRGLFVSVLAVAAVWGFPSNKNLHHLVQTALTAGTAQGGDATPTALGNLATEQLTLMSKDTDSATIQLGNTVDGFTIEMTDDGSFKISHKGQPGFTISPEGHITFAGKVETTGVLKLDGAFIFKGQPQWLLVKRDTFHVDDQGWSYNGTQADGQTGLTSKCNEAHPITMLGGYKNFAGGTAKRTYDNLDLPNTEHTEVRIQANFHFIDEWAGEMAFMKVEHKHVWTETHDEEKGSTSGTQVCGKADTMESKFSIPIDVTVPHVGPSLNLGFGSTTTKKPGEASWGVSGLQIYIR